MDLWHEILKTLETPNTMTKLLYILLGSFVLYFIIKKVLSKKLKAKLIQKDERRFKTMKSLVENIVKYTLIFIILMYALSLIGVDPTTIGASIGAIGIVFGLAFQDLLKDFYSGVFIVFENQYAVGDIVSIGTFTGRIVALGLRTTKIEAETGEIKTISNRNIVESVNYSINNATAIVDVTLGYDNDIDQVEEFFQDLMKHLNKKITNVKSEFKYTGIQSVNDLITFRIEVEVAPMKQHRIQSAILKEYKSELEKTNFKRN